MAPVLVIAFTVLALRCLVALALVPPWQPPDEASHVALTELSRSRILRAAEVPDPAREGEILQSMAAHKWWRHRGVAWPIPVPVPSRFGQAGAGNGVAAEVTGITEPPAYFRLTGRLLSWFPRLSITQDVYVLRGVSVLFGLLTLSAVWLATREFAGPSFAAAVSLLLAVHPAFALASTAATPDAATNFLGACLWWRIAVAVRAPSLARHALVWVVAIAAAATDRMGVPLILVALLVSMGVPAIAARPRSGRLALMLAVTAVAGIGALAVMAGVLQGFGESYGLRRAFSALAPVDGAMTWGRFIEFNWQLHRSWWYAIGWGRYLPPWWWTVAATAITLAAALGLARRWFAVSGFTSPSRATLALALAGIAIQVLAIHWAYFRLGNGGQGRYLFPMLVPALILLWAGIEAWVPRELRWRAAGALVTLVALLDVAAWILVAVPAYYASF